MEASQVYFFSSPRKSFRAHVKMSIHFTLNKGSNRLERVLFIKVKTQGFRLT
jgi:hypothetical protein